MRRLLASGAVLLLAACAGSPPPPDWQLGSHGALAAFERHWFAGNTRVAEAEFARARQEAARTGRLELAARLELVRCALRIASLDFEPCVAFEARRADALAADRAYADFLAGRWSGLDAAALPDPYRGVVATGADAAAVLGAIESPRSRLIAAAALLRANRLSPQGIELAVAAASAQGWRRPLLAWLGLQLQRAEAAGARDEAARLQRRVDLVLGAPDETAKPGSAPPPAR